MRKLIKIKTDYIHLLKLFIITIISSCIFAFTVFILVIDRVPNGRSNLKFWLTFLILLLTLIICLYILHRKGTKHQKTASYHKAKSYFIVSILMIISFLYISIGPIKNRLKKDSFTETFEYNSRDRKLNELFDRLAASKDGNLDTLAVKELATILGGNSNNWQKIKSENGNFQIEFPDVHVKQSELKQIINNELVITHVFSVNAQEKIDDNVAYSLNYSFLPKIKTLEQLNNLFNQQRDHVISATNSRLEHEFIIDSLQFPARELLFTIDDSKLKMHYRMYFDHGFFYTLVVITEEGNLFNKSINRFFNSFNTIKKHHHKFDESKIKAINI